MCRLSWNLGTSTSWNPQGLSRPVMGLLYFYLLSCMNWIVWHTRTVNCLTLMWHSVVESSWNVMAHGDAREGKWRVNWRMEWVASTLHTTSEHGVSSITTADTHTSAASSRLNSRPRRCKWTRPLRRKTKSDFCACAITFQTQSTAQLAVTDCHPFRARVFLPLITNL